MHFPTNFWSYAPRGPLFRLKTVYPSSQRASLSYFWPISQDLKIHLNLTSKIIQSSYSSKTSSKSHVEGRWTLKLKKPVVFYIFALMKTFIDSLELNFNWMIILDFLFMRVFEYLKTVHKQPRYTGFGRAMDERALPAGHSQLFVTYFNFPLHFNLPTCSVTFYSFLSICLTYSRW